MKASVLPHVRSHEPCVPVLELESDPKASALRGLLRYVDSVREFDTEQILLDTDVDGSRYLLVRMPRVNPEGPPLSPREQEVARMVSRGCPNKVIADVLNISPWTVCTHLRRIFAKLGVTTRAAMVGKMLVVRTSRTAHDAKE